VSDGHPWSHPKRVKIFHRQAPGGLGCCVHFLYASLELILHPKGPEWQLFARPLSSVPDVRLGTAILCSSDAGHATLVPRSIAARNGWRRDALRWYRGHRLWDIVCSWCLYVTGSLTWTAVTNSRSQQVLSLLTLSLRLSSPPIAARSMCAVDMSLSRPVCLSDHEGRLGWEAKKAHM
jgi:hypothetical protein